MENSQKTKNQRVTECRQKLYDQIQINLPKGTREKYKAFAKSQNMSLNGFILKAMDSYIENHSLTFITMLEVPTSSAQQEVSQTTEKRTD